ncbi:MAG TPA: isoprenylcysteine carboxylmethyltransferase family protein, partial [bacterium]
AVRLAVLILFLIAALSLFESGHVAVSGDQRPNRVITAGAFRYVRHPLYLASILTYFGLTVSTCSLLAIALFVAICFFYTYLASYEEKVMVNKFGEEYAEYMKKTGKWLPRFGKKGE